MLVERHGQASVSDDIHFPALQRHEHIGCTGYTLDVCTGSQLGDGDILDAAQRNANPFPIQCPEHGGNLLLDILIAVGSKPGDVAKGSSDNEQCSRSNRFPVFLVLEGGKQPADEPGHEKVDEGRHDEREEGVEGARADEV